MTPDPAPTAPAAPPKRDRRRKRATPKNIATVPEGPAVAPEEKTRGEPVTATAVAPPTAEMTLPMATTLSDPEIRGDRLMLEGIDTSGGPLFTVSEMAMVFFARSSHWVRWLEGLGRLVLDGEELVALRTPSGARKYDLALIEKIAHALASNETIKTGQLRNALLMVKIQAEMHDYII